MDRIGKFGVNKLGGICLCLLLASSCANFKNDLFDRSKHDLIDPDLKLGRDDYRDTYNQDKKGVGAAKNGSSMEEPPVPELAEILASPKPPKIGESKLVSVAVTSDVPLKDVLIELARLADVDVEVDSSIEGGIDFRAKDRPFNEVIERISDLAGLRYSMKNNVLRVERDTPYVQIYSLTLLNVERVANSNISVNTTGGGSGGGGPGGSTNSGSSSSISGKSDSDFWSMFNKSIEQILAYHPAQRSTFSTLPVQPAPVAQTAAAPGAAPAAPAAAALTPTRSAVGGAGAAPGGGGGASAPAAGGAGAGGAAAGGAGGSGGAGGDQPFYVINRQAGTMTVSATERQHDMIRHFIKKIQANSSAQVLIEAKIMEVDLKDEYQTGINWGQLGGDTIRMGGPGIKFKNSGTNVVTFPAQFSAGTGTNGGTSDPNNAASFLINKTIGGVTLEAAAKMAETFGTTRALSSPRLNATNNQQAVLTFATNVVYYELKIDQQDQVIAANGQVTPGKTTVTSTMHTVPIGLILSLQPSIDTENNEVILSVRPTLSRITSMVDDPAIAYLAKVNDIALVSQTPVVELRELDSILKLKSGQVMVIGGLMMDKSENTDKGVPGVSSVPYLGNLFKSVDKGRNMSELVIFIRATIVGTSGDADQADKALYNKFMNDPRPLNFTP